MCPTSRQANPWAYEYLYPIADFGTYFAGAGLFKLAPMVAFYKDPCVIPVPASLGTGYFMFLVRGRVPAEELTPDWESLQSNEFAAYLADHMGFGDAIWDIVVYHCEDTRFDGTTKGPFLLVHSMAAQADPALYDSGASVTGAAFRCALGVPGAVFVDDDLFLFYVAAAVREADTAAWLGAPSNLDECIDAFDGGAGFTEATVVRRISATAVRNLIIGATPPPELEWTASDAVPGTMSLPIRPWVATMGSPSYEVERLEDVCLPIARAVNTAIESARVVDPQPIANPLAPGPGDEAHLFFALRPDRENMLGTADNLLFGAWRAAFLPDGLNLLLDTGRTTDRVYCSDSNALVYFEGHAAAVLKPWDKAWSADADLLPGKYPEPSDVWQWWRGPRAA